MTIKKYFINLAYGFGLALTTPVVAIIISLAIIAKSLMGRKCVVMLSEGI